MIHTLPLVKFLRKKYKEASIEYVTSENVADLLKNCCPYINHAWIYNKKNKKQLSGKIFSVNKNKIDYFFNLHNSLSFFFFNLFYIRAKNFFQYKKDIKFHAVVNFAQTYDPLLSAFGLETKTVFAGDCNEILNKYGLEANRYTCFVTGVGKERPNRAWQFEKWFNLTKKFLNAEKDFKVVLLGGEYEQKIIENWYKLAKDVSAYKDEEEQYDLKSLPGFKNRAINLTGKLSLPEVAKIISKAAHVISCDTGLLHLGAALSVKTIGLYGPTLPKRSGPFTGDYLVLQAKNCECISNYVEIKKCRKTGELSGYCMNSLTVEEVLSNISCNLVEIV